MIWGGWVTAFRPDLFDRALEMFQQELLFTHEGMDYWMPVRYDRVQALQARVPPGDAVTVAVLWFGINHQRELLDWVFWIDNFAH